MKRTFYIAAVFLFLLSAHAAGHEDSPGKAFIINIPQFSEAPKIDGKLGDSVWLEAAVLKDFTQYEPVEGSDPTEKTIAYIGYDANNLYLAVHCYDSNPNAVRACLTQRDKSMGDDEVTIYLDTFNDKKRAFAFVVNPCGVQTDGIFTEQRQMGRGHRGGGGGGGGGGFDRIDKNWDTFFSTGAFIDDSGFSVELAIPFKSLRFPNSLEQTWGLQIKRKIPRKNEEIYWSPRSRDINGFLIQSGMMTIGGDLAKGKNLEIMPVITGLKERQGTFKPEPSINFKYGITSDLTTDLAINPDFSQIEADMPQIDVNQRYALYYREKRPFFLEGKDLFDTPLELVYTRKIVNPLWGTKLTGKIGKTSLAFLSAYDESPPEIDIGLDDDEEEEEDDEGVDYGRSWVNVFRMKHDLFSESNIGFILTDKEMGAKGQSLSRNFNRVAGVDGYFKFKKHYKFNFQVLGSQSQVEQAASNTVEKTGVIPAMFFNFSRDSRHWSLSADYTQMPEEFEAATGFFRRKDIRSLGTRLGYNILPQNKYVVDIRPGIEYRRIYDFNNILTDEQFRIGGFISGWRGSFLFANYSQELERYEGINFRKQGARFSLNSEPFSWFSGNISYSFGDGIYYDENPYLGYKTSIGMRLTFKPMTTLRLFYNIKQDNFSSSKGGERVYRINLISQRISLQLSRSLSLRLITDYNDYYKDFYSSILLSYQLNPGTVFYVGIDDNQSMNDSGIYDIEGRYFFVKFSYWWRL